MRGVTQRTVGYPFGECVRASYATILGLPIEEVPRFDPGALGDRDGQRQCERAWLASLGFDLVEISAPAPSELGPDVLGCVPPVVHLISGISPRGFGHRCVGYGGRVVWDPHPSRDGLVTVNSIGFLVPFEEV